MVGGVKEAKVDIWKAMEGDWIQDRLKSIKVTIDEHTPAILMRLPEVTQCLGLGKEVEYLEAALRDNVGLPQLEVHPPVTTHRSRVLNVLAWIGVSSVSRLTQSNRLHHNRGPRMARPSSPSRLLEVA